MIVGVPTDVPITMIDAVTGELAPGLTISGTDVLVSRANGAWTEADGVVDEVGGAGNGLGAYFYTPVPDDVVVPGFRLRIEKDGYVPYEYAVDVEIETSPTTIRDAILNYAFRPGRTLRGHWRRMDGMFFNKAIGLLSSILNGMKIYQPDGITVEFQGTQDVALGTRQGVDVTTSETP